MDFWIPVPKDFSFKNLLDFIPLPPDTFTLLSRPSVYRLFRLLDAVIIR